MAPIPEPERLTAIDHPEQRTVVRSGGFPRFMRVDRTHELPIVFLDARGKVVARFAEPFDAARYIHGRMTFGPGLLPLPIVEALDWSDR